MSKITDWKLSEIKTICKAHMGRYQHDCDNCPIGDFCMDYFGHEHCPETWDVDTGETAAPNTLYVVRWDYDGDSITHVFQNYAEAVKSVKEAFEDAMDIEDGIDYEDHDDNFEWYRIVFTNDTVESCDITQCQLY